MTALEINPYRTDIEAEERARRDLECKLSDYLREVKKITLSDHSIDLLLNIGYSLKDIQNPDYFDAKTRLFYRDKGQYVDLLVECNFSEYFHFSKGSKLYYLTYFITEKQQCELLISDIARTLSGRKLSRRGLAKKIAEPLVAYSFLVGLGGLLSLIFDKPMDYNHLFFQPIASCVGYFGAKTLLTYSSPDIFTEHLNYLSQTRINKTKKSYGVQALIDACYLVCVS